MGWLSSGPGGGTIWKALAEPQVPGFLQCTNRVFSLSLVYPVFQPLDVLRSDVSLVWTSLFLSTDFKSEEQSLVNGWFFETLHMDPLHLQIWQQDLNMW